MSKWKTITISLLIIVFVNLLTCVGALAEDNSPIFPYDDINLFNVPMTDAIQYLNENGYTKADSSKEFPKFKAYENKNKPVQRVLLSVDDETYYTNVVVLYCTGDKDAKDIVSLLNTQYGESVKGIAAQFDGNAYFWITDKYTYVISVKGSLNNVKKEKEPYVFMVTPSNEESSNGGQNDPTPTSQPAISVKWVLDQYADEFGRQTGDKIVRNESLIYGTFSNSAVQDAKLGVFVVADKSDIYLILYEYGNVMLNNPLTTKTNFYDVSILNANNTKFTLKGAIGPGDFRLYFDNSNTVINAMKSGAISFAITKSGSQINRYNFNIEDTSDFGALYSQVSK